ncbi:uncharacterized protein LOC123203416 [Mangifera indica]|uniref:uncharacterized protein LOC123203416 n=1 Tax=Mangifera indica TaxID=29780 RepID=UPI001CFAD35D|nr:uncharacterized protein LOC123203416 [Mangifera indica]
MSSSNFTGVTAPVFSGENYAAWAVKMKAYLRASDLWDVVEVDKQPNPLLENPTLNQIKHHSEETAKSEKSKQMQIFNLKREFALLRMKDGESVKGFIDRLMKIVNQLTFLGEITSESKVVEQVLVSLLEKFEAKISSLEDSKDMSTMTISKLSNSLQAVELRQAFRDNVTVSEGAFTYVNKKGKEKKDGYVKRQRGKKGRFSPCLHCKKTSHTEKYYWYRPEIQCRGCKEFGHMEKVCKNKGKTTQQQAKVAENLQEKQEHSEEQLFTVDCHNAQFHPRNWLLDSGCTNYMTFDKSLFINLRKSKISNVKIGNGKLLQV